MSHSLFLAVGYAVACALWWATSRMVPLWRNPPRSTFAKPWREVLFVLLGVVGTLLVGQLWSHGIRLNSENSLTESINQIVIFAPILLVPILRRQGWASAWIQWNKIWLRVLIGLVISWIVLFLFTQLEAGAPSFGVAFHSIFAPWNTHIAVQVLLEDIAIAILFVRLAAAIGHRKAIIGVALLFAAAHIPADLAGIVGIGPHRSSTRLRPRAHRARYCVAQRRHRVALAGPFHVGHDTVLGQLGGRA